MELHFRDGERIYQLVRDMVSDALSHKELIPEVDLEKKQGKQKEERRRRRENQDRSLLNAGVWKRWQEVSSEAAKCLLTVERADQPPAVSPVPPVHKPLTGKLQGIFFLISHLRNRRFLSSGNCRLWRTAGRTNDAIPA